VPEGEFSFMLLAIWLLSHWVGFVVDPCFVAGTTGWPSDRSERKEGGSLQLDRSANNLRLVEQNNILLKENKTLEDLRVSLTDRVDGLS
jgi:hypothetical protein